MQKITEPLFTKVEPIDTNDPVWISVNGVEYMISKPVVVPVDVVQTLLATGKIKITTPIKED